MSLTKEEYEEIYQMGLELYNRQLSLVVNCIGIRLMDMAEDVIGQQLSRPIKSRTKSKEAT